MGWDRGGCNAIALHPWYAKAAPLNIDQLVWDEENEWHIWDRHRLRPDDVEQAVTSHDVMYRSRSGRVVLRGRTRKGHILVVVLAPGFSETSWYVVTARPASRKERQGSGEGV